MVRVIAAAFALARMAMPRTAVVEAMIVAGMLILSTMAVIRMLAVRRCRGVPAVMRRAGERMHGRSHPLEGKGQDRQQQQKSRDTYTHGAASLI